MDERPRVSFVAALRNTDYGGDLLRRVNNFVNNIIGYSHSIQLRCEIVLVEWNPSVDSDCLHESLSIAQHSEFVTLRIITVPPSLHHEIARSDVVPPFLESYAKSVGLRRAAGEFLLATNPDVIFSRGLFSFLQSSPVRNTLYRIDRHDVDRDLPKGLSIDEQISFCCANIESIHSLYASIRFDSPAPPEVLTRRHPGQKKLLAEYQRIDGDANYVSPFAEQLIFPVDGIHTNAAGCFLLLDRDAWRQIRGCAELLSRGHLDAITCWSALSAGFRQEILNIPCLMFHQPHHRDGSTNWPQTDWHLWYSKFRDARQSNHQLVTNRIDWGLANENLEEWRLHDFGVWRRVDSDTTEVDAPAMFPSYASS